MINVFKIQDKDTSCQVSIEYVSTPFINS